MRVAFLGLGLIGGSIARALVTRTPGEWRVTAWTPDGTGPRLAAAAGVIDAAAPGAGDAIDGSELIVLAAPPLDCLELLRQLAGPLRDRLPAGAVITDVASSKGAIVSTADRLGLRFVGGHPMAGREVGGFDASDGELFRGRPWVVVPSADADAMRRVEALAEACGAAVIRMTAGEHDRAVAAISHLPLVVSAALVEAVAGRPGSPEGDWPAAAAVAAGGWESMTRLARGDVAMGTGIAVTNAPELARRLHVLRDVLDAWLGELERADGPDADAIHARLAAARQTLADEGG